MCRFTKPLDYASSNSQCAQKSKGQASDECWAAKRQRNSAPSSTIDPSNAREALIPCPYCDDPSRRDLSQLVAVPLEARLRRRAVVPRQAEAKPLIGLDETAAEVASDNVLTIGDDLIHWGVGGAEDAAGARRAESCVLRKRLVEFILQLVHCHLLHALAHLEHYVEAFRGPSDGIGLSRKVHNFEINSIAKGKRGAKHYK